MPSDAADIVLSVRIDFVTIFPKMFEPLLAEGIIARGIKQGRLDVRVWDLRDYATDKHRSTDDEAYGGGPGMVMLAEPVLRCVEAIRDEGRSAGVPPASCGRPRPTVVSAQVTQAAQNPPSGEGARRMQAGTPALREIGDPYPSSLVPAVVMTSPQGRLFTQSVARELANKEHLVILCGRYEGFDERIREALQPDEVSIGDFVVSGGELPAMLIADAVGRMIEGVVGNSGSVEEDSFFRGLLDYPHYTRPEELRGMRVPDVLLSGHHEKIRKWRKEQALRATLAKRPDLLETADLDDEARSMLKRIGEE
jgi:tRNA (guanine37-N1)-methyltransferase